MDAPPQLPRSAIKFTLSPVSGGWKARHGPVEIAKGFVPVSSSVSKMMHEAEREIFRHPDVVSYLGGEREPGCRLDGSCRQSAEG